MFDWLGWTATALFTSSYFFRRPAALRGVQMTAAALWVAYGVVLQAVPVIAANLLVVAAAGASAWTGRGSISSSLAASRVTDHLTASACRRERVDAELGRVGQMWGTPSGVIGPRFRRPEGRSVPRPCTRSTPTGTDRRAPDVGRQGPPQRG